MKSVALGELPAASPDRTGFADPGIWRQFPGRVATFCIVELQKLRHDRTELVTRAVQPVLWLLIFGETFNRIHAIPTGGRSYLDFLAPGIIAQSGLFVAIFYGIQIIWERDAGVLTKLLVTPTPRSALILGKSFAAGIRADAQVVVVLVLSAILGVELTTNPLAILGAFLIVMMGSVFFACLSMSIAGVVLKRDRLMGIGQMITMPLFFASNALYPIAIMPAWLRVLSRVNPLSYEVDALRGLLIHWPAHLALDFGVLAVAVVVGVTAASALVGRLARSSALGRGDGAAQADGHTAGRPGSPRRKAQPPIRAAKLCRPLSHPPGDATASRICSQPFPWRSRLRCSSSTRVRLGPSGTKRTSTSLARSGSDSSCHCRLMSQLMTNRRGGS